jgi:hypothetical protein
MKIIRDPVGDLIKVCPKCQTVVLGKWQSVRRHFGLDDARADGLAVYCKECRRRLRRAQRP